MKIPNLKHRISVDVFGYAMKGGRRRKRRREMQEGREEQRALLTLAKTSRILKDVEKEPPAAAGEHT